MRNNAVCVIFALAILLVTNLQSMECPLGAEIKLADQNKILSHETDRIAFNLIVSASPVLQKLIAQDPKSIDLAHLSYAQFLILENLARLLTNPKALAHELSTRYALPDALLRILQASLDLQIDSLRNASLEVLAKQLGGEKELSVSREMYEKNELMKPTIEFMNRLSAAKYSKEIKALLRPLLIPHYERILAAVSSQVFSISDVRALAMAQNNSGHLIASSGNGSLMLWNFKTGNKIKEIREKGIVYHSLSVGNNQQLLVGTSANKLYFFNANDLMPAGDEKQLDNIITSAAAHPFQAICVAAQYGDVTYLDLAKKQQLNILQQTTAIFYGAAFSASGKVFGIVGNDANLHLFNITNKSKEELNVAAGYSIAFNPKNDDQIILGAQTGFSIINIRQRASGFFENMKEPVKTVAFSPDGRRFAAASESKILIGHLNGAAEIKHRFSLPGITSLTFDSNNRLLVIGTKNGIRIFDYSAYENGPVDTDSIVYLAALEQVVRSARGFGKSCNTELPSEIKNEMRKVLPSFLNNFIDHPTLFVPEVSKEEEKEESLEREIAEFEKVPASLPKEKRESWRGYFRSKLGY